MCEQCMARTVNLGEPVPGFFLVKARQDGHTMKAGQYGLVQCNDPDFIWDGKPTRCPEGDESKWWSWLSEVEDQFDCNPIVGYNLVRACRKVGYRPDRHGYNVICWLFERMADHLKDRTKLKSGRKKRQKKN